MRAEEPEQEDAGTPSKVFLAAGVRLLDLVHSRLREKGSNPVGSIPTWVYSHSRTEASTRGLTCCPVVSGGRQAEQDVASSPKERRKRHRNFDMLALHTRKT